MLPKKKRDQTVRDRMVADGQKQQAMAVKGEAALPMVCIGSIFITEVVEAYEGRDITMVDLPSTYLHADNDTILHMELRGKLVELMARVDPSLYRKYISSDDKEMPILYIRLNKAIYRLLKSALLFYQKL